MQSQLHKQGSKLQMIYSTGKERQDGLPYVFLLFDSQ